jgi:SAM-dependent MidA family methyltransferase
LEPFSGRVCWIESLDQLAEDTGGVHGVIFSNELLDAFPVRRFAWNRAEGRWFEWQVSGDESRFFSVSGPPLTPEEAACELDWVPRELEPHLPDGYVVETSPAALEWWHRAAQTLKRGHLMTVDYGFDDAGALQPERTDGTLRTYRRHRVGTDLLRDPGEQDLTAHVNFSRIIQAGECAGMRTEAFVEQGRFLSQVLQAALDSPWVEKFSTPENVRSFRTLIHPDHFGRLFHVLIQRR